MKKAKLYLIISILFVVISIILTNGFKGTYSAPTGDLGGEGDLYWAIDGTDCDNNYNYSTTCTLKISNNPIDGEHFVYGKLDGNNQYTESSIPWKDYRRGIGYVFIGGENDIVKPNYINYWFFYFEKVREININYLDTSLVTDMSHMFWCNYFLTNIIGLENLDTSLVTDMSMMFDECHSLSNINVSSFNTSNVTSMAYMFSGCEKLIELDLSNFNTSNVNAMYDMFSGCEKLIELDLSNFNTSKVAKFSSMFDDCVKLEKLNLSSFDTIRGESYYPNINMFDNTPSLYEIKVGNKWKSLLSNDKWVNIDTGEVYLDGNIPILTAATYKSPRINWMVYGEECNSKNANCILVISNECDEIDSFVYGRFKDTDTFTVAPWNKYSAGIKSISVGNKNDIIVPMASTAYWFDSLSISNSLNLEYLDTSNVTNMLAMFNKFNGKIIGLENLDTSNVTNMGHMFGYCHIINEIDLSNWNTSSVKNMSFMFDFAHFNNLSEMDLSSWNTSNVIYMYDMFANSNIVKINLNGWDVSNVTDMDQMFKNSSIGVLDLSNWNTSKVTNMTNMFNSEKITQVSVGVDFNLPLSNNTWKNIETGNLYYSGDIPKNTKATYEKLSDYIYWTIDDDTLILSNYDNFDYDGILDTYRNINDQNNWHYYYDSIKKVQIGGENDIIKPHNMNSWFYELYKVKEIDLTYLDTSEVIDMSYAFSTGYCSESTCSSKLTKIIGLDKLNTSNVIDMTGMFQNNYKITELDLSIFDTSNVTTLSYMFYNCSSLEELDLSNFDTTKIDDYYNIFNNTNLLSQIKVGNNWTLPLKNDNSWVNDKTGEVYEYGEIPQNTSATYRIPAIYYIINEDECRYTDKCKLIISNNPILDENMHNFQINTLLPVATQITDEYINIGSIITEVQVGGPDDIIKPLNMRGMFATLSNIKEIDLQYLDTSIAIDMSYLFYNDYSLEKIDVSNFDTSKVEYMDLMFGFEIICKNDICTAGSNKLKEIKGLNKFDTSNVESMSGIFAGQGGLETIDVSSFDTSNVESMSYMFACAKADDIDNLIYESSLKEIKGIENFDTTNVRSYFNMFAGNNKLKKLDLTGFNTSNENYCNLLDYEDERNECFKTMFMENNSLTKVKVSENWNLPLMNDVWLNDETSEIYEYGEIPENVSATYIRPIVYWAINDDTLTISNNYIEGNVDYGIINTMMEPHEQDSWIYDYDSNRYINTIKKVQLGGKSDIIKPFNMNSWFHALYNVEELDLTYLDTSNTFDMGYAFATGYCKNLDDDSTCSSALTSIIGLDKLNTSNVVYMDGTFGYNMSLKEINISNIDTSNVESMYELFAYDFELETIKGLDKLDTSNSYDIDWLFYKCKKLKELDLSNIDTSNVEYIYGMFVDDVSLESIIGIENFDLTKVNDLEEMFYNCKHLKELDLSGWNTLNIENVDNMFKNTNMLNKVKVGANWDLQLSDNTWKNIETNVVYEYGEIPENVAATYVKTNEQFYWKYDKNTLTISNNLDMSGEDYGAFDKDKSFVNYDFEDIPWYKYVSKIKNVIIGSEEDILHPTNIDGWFMGLLNVEEIDVTYIDTSDVTSMVYIFSTMYCDDDTGVWYSSLKKIKGLENFNTSKVENFNGMFDGNIMLEELDLSNFDTGSETYCSSFDDEETRNNCQSNMFGELSGLKEIKVGDKFDFLLPYSTWINKETSESYEEGLIPKNIAATYVRDMYYWAVNNDTLTISNNEITGNVDSGVFSEYSYYDKPWSKYYKNIKNIIVGDNNSIVKPIYMYSWFADLPYLENIYVTNVDTSELETSERLYSYSDNIKKIIVGDKWSLPLTEDDWYNEETGVMYEYGEIPVNTAATYIRPIIYYIANEYECMNTNKCTGIISNTPIYGENMINIPVNTLNPIGDQLPLEELGSVITSIKVGGQDDIIKPYNMNGMFAYLSNIKKIDLQYLDTSNVTDMGYLFYNTSSLESIDVSNFDTRNVENMASMFSVTEKCDDRGCSFGSDKLKEIKGLNKFNTSNVIDMSGMFMGQGGLESIDVSSFDTSKVESMAYMFECLTASEAEEKINSNLKEIKGLENFDTTNVENYTGMFAGDIKLKELDLSGFNTSNEYFCKLLDDENEINECYSTMFMYNDSLTKVKIGENWNLILTSDIWMNEETGDVYEDGLIPENVSATYIRPIIYYIANEYECMNTNKCKLIISNTPIYDENMINIPVNTLYSINVQLPSLEMKSVVTSMQVGGPDDIIKPYNMNGMFSHFPNVKSIDLAYLDTSSANDMAYAFAYSGFETIDVSNFNTSKVANMSSMFAGHSSCFTSSKPIESVKSNVSGLPTCVLSRLKEIKGLESFDTSNVMYFDYMFDANPYLREIDLSSFDISNAEICLSKSTNPNMNHDTKVNESSSCTYSIFGDELESLQKVKVGDKFTFDLPEDYNWINEETGDIYGYGDIPKNVAATYIRPIVYWAVDDDTLILSSNPVEGNVDFGEYDTGFYTDFDTYVPWKEYSDGIINIQIGGPNDIVKPSNMSKMFAKLSNVKEIDLTYLDTSSANDMAYAFAYSGFETIDVSNFNTSNVISMEGMFVNDSCFPIYEKSTKPINGVESNVSRTECIASRLKEIKGLKNFDTSNVIYFDYMFSGNSNLRELDLSSFDTTNAEICAIKSTKSNLSHDTKVNAGYAFEYNCTENIFGDDLDSLQKVEVGNKFTLDLPLNYNWVNDETGEMYEYGDIPENVAATYIRPIVYWAVDDDTLILSSNLVEGNVDFGMIDTTDYDTPWQNYDDIVTEVIIGSEDDIIKPYNMISWFFDFDNVKELDLSYIDTQYLDTISSLFNGMESLEKINLRNFDLSNISYCRYATSTNPNLNINSKVNGISDYSGCDIFGNNNNLREISLSKNNAKIVSESLGNPSNEYINGANGVWYNVDGEVYDASELPEEDATYYALKPHKVTYNVDGVEPQAKIVGEDLRLYDEIIKESKIEEITTSFDTSINEEIVDVTTGVEESFNELDDIISLKITTYTLKNFTDKDKNIYLPGSIYTVDENLELDVNYDEEVHYNSIELPIPVKHGYKFEYWTLDGKRISEYTPKSNKTLVAVWSEIKHSFINDEIEYEKESSGLVIFETDGIIENFKNLYVNGKKLELGKDYVIDENKIILTNDGIEYLDSLEPGEYEVKAEFSDSNSDVYGIIKVSEKEEPQEEPENEPKEPDTPDEPEDNPITPKTGDYILFAIIIAITALLSSIFVYKKIEY